MTLYTNKITWALGCIINVLPESKQWMKLCYSNSVASHHKTWHSQPPSNIVIEQRLGADSFIIIVVVIYQVFHKSVQSLTDCVHFKGLSPFLKMRSMSNWICSLNAWLNFFWKDGDQPSGSKWTQLNTLTICCLTSTSSIWKEKHSTP